MNRFFIIFLPIFLFSTYINFPYTLTLKKDEKAVFDVYYKNFSHSFILWWTLYKNDVLTVIYIYDNFPHHIELYKNYPVNSFKVKITDLVEPFPYFWIKFDSFNDENATFKIYLFNKKGVKVNFKGKE